MTVFHEPIGIEKRIRSGGSELGLMEKWRQWRLKQWHDRLRWPGQDDPFSLFDQGTLQKVRVPDHEVDQFVF